MQNWEQAIQVLEESLSKEPDQSVCRQLADAYAVRGRLKDTVATYLRLSQMLGEAGDFEAAMQTAKLALNLEPASIPARVQRISLLQRRSDPELPEACIELSRLYLDQGQSREALDLLEKACLQQPDHFELALELGETHLILAQFREARQHFGALAQSCWQRGRLMDACTAFRRLKVMAPDEAGVLMELARVYQERGCLREAEQELRGVLRLDLNHQEALHRLGQVSMAQGHYRDSILAYNRLLSLEPGQAEALRGLAEAYQAQGLVSDACKFWEQAARAYLSRQPIDSGADPQQRDRAVEALRKLLSLDGGQVWALQELQRLGVSRLAPEPKADIHSGLPPECTEPVFLQSLPAPVWFEPVAAEEVPEWLLSGDESAPLRLLTVSESSGLKAGFTDVGTDWNRSRFTVEGSLSDLRIRLQELDLPQQFAEYRAFLKNSPQRASVWAELAGLLLRSGLTEEALDCLRAGLEHCPDADELRRAYMEALIWNQNFGQALDFGLSLAEAYRAEGRGVEAQDLLQKLLWLEPSDLRARQLLVDCLVQPPLKLMQLGQLAHQAEQQGCWALARQACEQLMACGANPILWERIGYYHQHEGNHEEARAAYLQVLPYLENGGRIFEAQTVCGRLAAMRPEEVRFKLRQVELLQQWGWEEAWRDQAIDLAGRLYRGHRGGEALVWLQRVLHRVGSDSRAWELGFRIHRDSQNVELALEWAQGWRDSLRQAGEDEREILVEMLTLVPARADWWRDLAALCLQAGDPKAGRLALERLAELQPPEQAVETWQQVVRLAPDDFEAWARMAELCRLTADERALDCLRTCFRLQPDNRAVAQALLQGLLDAESYQQAAELLRTRLDWGLEFQASPFQRGQLYFHLEFWDQAIEQFQQSRRLPHLTAASLKMLGLCFAAKPGKLMLNLALAQLQKALQIASSDMRQELLYELARLELAAAV